MEAICTQHSYKRAKQRQGIKNRRTAKRIMCLALERGKGAADFRSLERMYLSSEESQGVVAKVYNSYCFIFSSEGACITQFPLPTWFGKTRTGQSDKRNYRRHIDVDCDCA